MWPGVRHTDIIVRNSLFFMSLWLFAAEMEALNHSVTSQHPVEKHMHLMVVNLFSRGEKKLSVIRHLFVEHRFVIFSCIAPTAQGSNVTVNS